jgi:hypothetical protein
MTLSEEKQDTLLIAFDAGLFNQDWSGKIEYRFRTPLARDFLNRLREHMA